MFNTCTIHAHLKEDILNRYDFEEYYNYECVSGTYVASLDIVNSKIDSSKINQIKDVSDIHELIEFFEARPYDDGCWNDDEYIIISEEPFLSLLKDYINKGN
jgi:hypothetical protein